MNEIDFEKYVLDTILNYHFMKVKQMVTSDDDIFNVQLQAETAREILKDIIQALPNKTTRSRYKTIIEAKLDNAFKSVCFHTDIDKGE